MALNGLYSAADVPLRNCSLTHTVVGHLADLDYLDHCKKKLPID